MKTPLTLEECIEDADRYLLRACDGYEHDEARSMAAAKISQAFTARAQLLLAQRGSAKAAVDAFRDVLMSRTDVVLGPIAPGVDGETLVMFVDVNPLHMHDAAERLWITWRMAQGLRDAGWKFRFSFVGRPYEKFPCLHPPSSFEIDGKEIPCCRTCGAPR